MSDREKTANEQAQAGVENWESVNDSDETPAHKETIQMNAENRTSAESGEPADCQETQPDSTDSPEVPEVGPSSDELKQQLAEKEEQLLRMAAEMENVRKRARRDAEEARKFGSMALLNDLLTVVDDLTRAIESADSNPQQGGLVDGVRMVSRQLESVLEKHHCRKIDALGKPFDPNCHEAVQMQPSTEYPANHVMYVTRPGYQCHDRVLRTAQVFVSTGPPADNEGAAGTAPQNPAAESSGQ